MEIETDDVKYQSRPEISEYDCWGCTFRHKQTECSSVLNKFDCSRERVIWEIKQNMGITPQHYKDTKLMDLLIEKDVGFAEGNIIKYVYRWKQKNGVEDLHKARTYLEALITFAELQDAGK